MSRRKPRHLAPVPTSAPAAPKPGPTYDRRIELPTGGRGDVDPLLRELARAAFRGNLVGFSVELDARVGLRCHVLVRVSDTFTDQQADKARTGILRALLAVGVLQPPKAAAAAPEAPPPAGEDGAPSPPPPPPSSQS